ncbi:uncharacterized protein LOC103522369 [Diaphorina citri]|uniref:Uncharacterized protein LOC103522369 n=1 Tax=Diaphorina citri TaxID=121845 RepID=A0A1S3DP92_DIACI|nr:uncharacterized protein LOC103522369 [Diaphorina citri]
MNFMLKISFLFILFVIAVIFICITFLFFYHLVLFLISDDNCSGIKSNKNNVGYFFRHYKFCRIRIFTISDSVSTNRVWVNPGSKYAQDNYSNHSYNSNYSGRSYNSNYSNSYNNQSGQQRSTEFSLFLILPVQTEFG